MPGKSIKKLKDRAVPEPILTPVRSSRHASEAAMRHCLIAVGLLLHVNDLLRAQDDRDLAKALALQRVMQKTIQQNEASIACILVSRSELYKRRANASAGELGDYDPANPDLDLQPNLSAEKKAQIVKKLDLADSQNVPPAFGSGIVIGGDGLILTNFHVVQDATKLYVRLPGGKGSYADIHAADGRSDLAVLKLRNRNVLPLKAVTLGDAETLERGQFVLTLSNPFAAGFRDGQPSASWGILSNIRRRPALHLKEEERIKPFHHYGNLLQTDARMHLGCSGGALMNLQGEVVGLLSAMAAIQGVETPGGFALPMNATMRHVIEVLKRGEEVEYGFLGVAFDEGQPNGAGGVKLKLVGKRSPADIAELKADDILMAVNGQPILESDDIYLHIGSYQAGSKIKLHYKRNGVERVADVTLAKLHVPGRRIVSSLGNRPYFRGMRVDWTSLLVQQEPRQPSIPLGVLVSDVQPNSPADKANLKAGDVITHVNQVEVKTPAAFYQGVANAIGPLEIMLNNNPVKVILK
jgi:serine protease Do